MIFHFLWTELYFLCFQFNSINGHRLSKLVNTVKFQTLLLIWTPNLANWSFTFLFAFNLSKNCATLSILSLGLSVISLRALANSFFELHSYNWLNYQTYTPVHKHNSGINLIRWDFWPLNFTVAIKRGWFLSFISTPYADW